jgi:hypothetical protein
MYRAFNRLLPAGPLTACVIFLGSSLAALGCRSTEVTFEWVDDPAQVRAAKTLRVVNREVTTLQERNGVRLTARSGNGVA